MDLNNAEVEGTSERVTERALSETSLRVYPIGTVLVAMYGGFQQIGRTGLLRVPAAVNQAVTAIQPKCDAIVPEFLIATLNYRVGYWRSVASSSRKDPNISSKDIRNFPLAYPSVPEQRAIAAVLSDADALIAALDQLIAKKRNLKLAAMQQLLTGRRRLPGFRGEWEVKRLGELGLFTKGRGIKKDEVVSEGLPCVRYGEIYTHHHDYLRSFNSFITPKTTKESQRIQQGDLLFAGSGETAEEIGKCIAFLGNEEAYAGGDIVIFRMANQDARFFGFLMNHSSVMRQKERMGQGDAVVHISARNLACLEIRLPPRPEQTAIADVLWDMDTELAALEQRRDKTRALKQGMMQELLTGRTRLV